MAKKLTKKAITLLAVMSILIGSNSFAFSDNRINFAPTATPSDASTESGGGTTEEGGSDGGSTTEQATDKDGKPITTQGVTITVPGQTISYTTTQTVILTEEELRARYGKEYDEKKTNLENALAFLNRLKQGQNSFMQEMIEMDELILAYNDKIEALKAEQEEIAGLIVETEKSLKEAEAAEKAQYEVIKSHIRNQYENGTYNAVEAMITSESFTDFLNKSEYVNAVGLYDNKLLDEYATTRKNIANKYAMLTTMQEDSSDLMEDYVDSEAALQVIADAKEEQVKSYDSDIADAQAEYSKLQAELESMLVQVETSTSYVYLGPAFITTGISAGKFQWPCPSSTRITSNFGGRSAPMAGASTYHKGVDIGAMMGAPIIAAADGMVIKVGYMGSGGNTVMIDHGNGVVTVYHHMSGYATTEGTVVKAGTVIGYVGSTGVSTGPHLHFGVRINGNYVDPMTYFR